MNSKALQSVAQKAGSKAKACAVTPQPKSSGPSYTDQDVDGGFSHPMLERIRKLLTSTDPEKWCIGGADLDQNLRFQRPRTSYEQVLIRDIPNASLVLHFVQPIQCQYGPGGYAPMPSGVAIYTVEVRDRIFDADKLIDPKFAANFAGKRCDIIASGEIAKSLFLQVKNTITTVCREKKRAFDAAVETVSRDIPELVKSLPFEAWTKTVGTTDDTKTVTYTAELPEHQLSLTLIKEAKGFEEKFRASFRREEFSHPHIPSGVARAALQQLLEIEQESQLGKLDGMLRELGFE